MPISSAVRETLPSVSSSFALMNSRSYASLASLKERNGSSQQAVLLLQGSAGHLPRPTRWSCMHDHVRSTVFRSSRTLPGQE